ncbi:hypothetical protein [Leptospira noguchii]|nr:hypothetical protein [Leptospira noguchii]
MSHFNYEICERFAPIFLRRTHVILHLESSASPNLFKMKMKEK